jgi:hypothetical protein
MSLTGSSAARILHEFHPGEIHQDRGATSSDSALSIRVRPVGVACWQIERGAHARSVRFVGRHAWRSPSGNTLPTHAARPFDPEALRHGRETIYGEAGRELRLCARRNATQSDMTLLAIRRSQSASNPPRRPHPQPSPYTQESTPKLTGVMVTSGKTGHAESQKLGKPMPPWRKYLSQPGSRRPWRWSSVTGNGVLRFMDAAGKIVATQYHASWIRRGRRPDA